ncbi:MAG: hypothetical protein HYY59_04735 [Candidatus Omnitrophica bacterium]|nr:hypothetical protein [Candidatus Omnitrophota bacterium]MBI3021286.1 hypothetical protein [Candidatus Omnitrophota bacterium]
MSSPCLRFFLGPDRARKLQRIHELERSLGIEPLDRHHVDAATTSAAELLALCRQQPAMSPLRLIVVDQAHRLDRISVDALRQHAGAIAKTACVILLVETELSLRHPLSEQPAKGTFAVERFPQYGAVATKPFAFTDALGAGEMGGALAAAHDQLVSGKEPLELLGLVAWQLNRWVLVKRMLGSGYPAERIGTVIGLRPWQVQRLQSEVARRSLASLQELLERCWQLDVDAKRGRAIPQLALEQLVTEICVSGSVTS